MPSLRADPAIDPLVVRAVARLADGDVLAALTAWRDADAQLRGEAPTIAWARPLFLRVEGRAPRGEVPQGPRPAEPASEAWALAWAGDVGGARALAQKSPDAPENLGLTGVLDVLERRWASGVALLDRAIAAGGGEELVLHRAYALGRVGRLQAASESLAKLVDGDSFSRRLIMALVSIKGHAIHPLARRWGRRVMKSEYVHGGLFSTELPAVVGRETLERAVASKSALVELLEGLVARMAGNLGASPTFAEVAPGGGRRYVRVDIPAPSRAACVAALDLLGHTGVASAEAALDALVRSRPGSPHVHTYRGELYLWLGRYDEAWREFVAARRVEPVRWADLGMLAVLVMKGQLLRARIMTAYGERHFPWIPGGTLPVYRGVLRRRLGDFRRAADDLRFSVDVKPTRLGARIELVLALRALGRHVEAATEAAIVLRDAAPLLVDVAESAGHPWRRDPGVLTTDDLLEDALRAMRGNRSSSFVTWIDRDRVVRVLARREEVVQHARQIRYRAPHA